MKSAGNKTGLPVPTTTSPLSHIPLPRRKNSSKGDKSVDVEDTDSEMSVECGRSQPKTSLLGGTSFCCASGQKEDCIPDFVPALRPPKKSVKKKDSPSGSPLLSQGRIFFSRNKRDKEKEEGMQPVVEKSIKPIIKEAKGKIVNNSTDNRIRVLNDKRKLAPPSPQRRPSSKDQAELRKFSDNASKLHRENSNAESGRSPKHPAVQVPSFGTVVNSKSVSVDSKFPKSEISVNCGKISVTKNDLKPPMKASHIDVQSASALNIYNEKSQNHQGDDLDCPCCDTVTMDKDISDDMGVKMFTNCDVIGMEQNVLRQHFDTQSDDKCDKEMSLELEVKSLKEDLEDGKQKLQNQQNRVQHLEEELLVMQQLKDELEKEKELRKIAEDKLLELLDHEKRMDALKRDSEKRMESKAIQWDPSEINQTVSSPLLSGYESRLRKYQTYIAKLEKDNLMLMNELKKFKDMSPRSQEEQARMLVDKLGEMERNNHQQQMQYESCLDEVANKLVQTLLVQKRLEEECKVLHLRVEQLEHENKSLLESIENDRKEMNLIENKEELATSPSILENRIPSQQPLSSSPSRRGILSPSSKSYALYEEKSKEIPKSLRLGKSPATSPISPGLKSCSSKIPSFSTTKPLMYRQKSELELPKPKSENRSKDALPSAKLPLHKMPVVPSVKSKVPHSKVAKGSCVKRKRSSRTGSPADKDSKQRIKTNHNRWEQRKITSENITPYCIDQNISLSPIPNCLPPQQLWSFNCQIAEPLNLPEVRSKVNESIDVLNSTIEPSAEFPQDFNGERKFSASDSSTATDGPNRTRDEGYSTMSSDLQQDSVADTTISEPEHSSTFVISEKSFGSDDSVTECMDSSMCSSSDSGFGPLNNVSNVTASSELPPEQDPNKVFEKLSKLDSCRKNGTVRSKDQIASVKPTIRRVPSSCSQSVNKDLNAVQTNIIHGGSARSDSVLVSQLTQTESATSPVKFNEPSINCDISFLPKSSNSEHLTYNMNNSNFIDCLDFPKDILGKSYRNSWHLGSSNSIGDEKILFCTRHSYIDDNLFDEKVQTAEKSTLTEPEEEFWREKALAPFIDESIWSLYSSEGDFQVKHFPLEPLLSEPSLEKLIASCSPCIIVSENIDENPSNEIHDVPNYKTISNSSAVDLNLSLKRDYCKFKPGLERVASDTVLYLKDAIHELEDSMRKGLKSSKNIPALHQNPSSESESSPDAGLVLKPELLRTLEATMSGQNNLPWPSPSHSSSTSSLQSSASCHAISDETEDVDGGISRKGSRDPDLSSDAEYENLEHKEFVERWLQKESACNNFPKQVVSQLEPVEELGEFNISSTERKSLSCTNSKSFHHRARRKSPDENSHSAENMFPDKIPDEVAENENIVIDCEENDLRLDPEATEFNGDFYTLCNIGSLKSLDRFSPARTFEHKQILVESPVLTKKFVPVSLSNSKGDKSKPTVLVKPTRPITLPISAVPVVPEHSSGTRVSVKAQTSPEKNASRTPRSKNENSQIAKLKTSIKVPSSRNSLAAQNCDKVQTKNIKPAEKPSISVKNKKPLPSSLPVSLTKQEETAPPVKVKSPTKILLKNSGSPSKNDEFLKRQQWRRERLRQNRLKEGCGTAWIHLQPNPELSDPTVRITLLDSIKAPTSSSGSSTEEEEEDVLVIQTTSHLHKICREQRNRVKASANNPLYDIKKRSSIMGRRELFYRFGEKEKEAIACFDFLEEIPSSSLEMLTKKMEASFDNEKQAVLSNTPPSNLSLPSHGTASNNNKERISFLSPTFGDASKMAATSDSASKMADFAKTPFSSYSARRLRLPNLWNQPLSHNMSSSTLNSQDCELLDHISLSDSCAESYSSSTPDSYDDVS